MREKERKRKENGLYPQLLNLLFASLYVSSFLSRVFLLTKIVLYCFSSTFHNVFLCKLNSIIYFPLVSDLFAKLHGPSMFAVNSIIYIFYWSRICLQNCTARQCSPSRRKFMDCSISNPALSLLMKHLVIGQRLKLLISRFFSLVTTR